MLVQDNPRSILNQTDLLLTYLLTYLLLITVPWHTHKVNKWHSAVRHKPRPLRTDKPDKLFGWLSIIFHRPSDSAYPCAGLGILWQLKVQREMQNCMNIYKRQMALWLVSISCIFTCIKSVKCKCDV